MKVSLFNTKITLQISSVAMDEVGNQIEYWQDAYTCFASVSHESPLENTSAGAMWDNSKIDFTIRYSSEVAKVDSLTHRVIFEDQIYNIKGIDHMNYKKKSLKIHCQRVER
ncbi:phage head closure protein [Streptococcus porci]|uniref:phage head closure protein n=1 Tax=Streptococcus porci TaxID=502567 RepID=UPI00041EC77A|nr:phage head closure protein [Streptococcus porci]QBX27899.1 putative head-tail adaptor [Streptococcus phage Javan422]